MRKQIDSVISAVFGVLVIGLGVYALLTGELKGRNGKPIDPGLARLCGVAFLALGGFLIVKSGGPNSSE